MTGFEIEELRFTAESVREAPERLPRFSNWPVVYLIEDGHDIYVCETGSADRRMAQHLKSTQKQQSPSYTSRMIAALADTHFAEGADENAAPSLLVEANTAVAERFRTATNALLGEVLFSASNHMTNRFSRSDG